MLWAKRKDVATLALTGIEIVKRQGRLLVSLRPTIAVADFPLRLFGSTVDQPGEDVRRRVNDGGVRGLMSWSRHV